MKKILKNTSKWLKNKDNKKDSEILRKRKLMKKKENHLKLEINLITKIILLKKVTMVLKNQRKWKSLISEEKIDK